MSEKAAVVVIVVAVVGSAAVGLRGEKIPPQKEFK